VQGLEDHQQRHRRVLARVGTCLRRALRAEDFVARFPSQANISSQVSAASGSYVTGTHDENVYVQTRLQRARHFSSGK